MIASLRLAMPAEMAAAPEPDEAGDSPDIDLREMLTPREMEIVRMVAGGLTNKEIAITLDISHWTVATHLRRVYSKLNVNRRAALPMALMQLQSSPGHPEI